MYSKWNSACTQQNLSRHLIPIANLACQLLTALIWAKEFLKIMDNRIRINCLNKLFTFHKHEIYEKSLRNRIRDIYDTRYLKFLDWSSGQVERYIQTIDIKNCLKLQKWHWNEAKMSDYLSTRKVNSINQIYWFDATS